MREHRCYNLKRIEINKRRKIVSLICLLQEVNNLRTEIVTEEEEELESINKKHKKNRWKNLRHRIAEHKMIYVMLIPVVLSFLIFSYYPMYGTILALKKFRPSLGIIGSDWADPLFIHFESVFSNPYFWRSIKNTLVVSGLKLLFCFPAPILLALFMNEVRFTRFKKAIQTIVYLPNFISWVIFGSIVYDIFGFEGIINNVLVSWGFDAKAFMSDTGWYYPILIFFTILKDSGWGSIIYLAAICNVSPNLYEAAKIDGCGRFKLMRHVTLPCISGIITIQLLLAIGNIMNAGFDAIFNTYNVQVYEVADILDTFIYRTGFGDSGNFEMATAIGLFKSIINFMLLLGANFIVKRINGTGIYDLGD